MKIKILSETLLIKSLARRERRRENSSSDNYDNGPASNYSFAVQHASDAGLGKSESLKYPLKQEGGSALNNKNFIYKTADGKQKINNNSNKKVTNID